MDDANAMLERVLAELRALRHENERLHTAVAALQARQAIDATAAAAEPGDTRHSRRGLLRLALGVSAAGASTLLWTRPQAALADSTAAFSSSMPSTPAVSAIGTNGAIGVSAQSDTGTALYGIGLGNIGVHGSSGQGAGAGVYGDTAGSGPGVHGQTLAAGDGVLAEALGSGNGLKAVAGGARRDAPGPTSAVLAIGGSVPALSALSGAGPASAAIAATGRNGTAGLSATSDSGSAICAAAGRASLPPGRRRGDRRRGRLRHRARRDKHRG